MHETMLSEDKGVGCKIQRSLLKRGELPDRIFDGIANGNTLSLKSFVHSSGLLCDRTVL